MSVLDAQQEIDAGLERMIEGLAGWYSDHTGAVYVCNSDPGDEQPDNSCCGKGASCNACRPCIGCVERCGQCG